MGLGYDARERVVHPEGLCRSMQGAGVFYNTHWVRYARGRVTFDLAVENTRTLFKAAERAGVGRIVHFSVTNASSGSGLPYFRGKSQVEDMLKGLGIPYAIIRPTLVFGEGDLLLNNMAWALRRFPVFPVYGSGDYPVQLAAIEYRMLAELAANAGRVLTYEHLLQRVLGPENNGDVRPMRTVVNTLRRKLRDNADLPTYIFTEPRVGYRMEEGETAEQPALS